MRRIDGCQPAMTCRTFIRGSCVSPIYKETAMRRHSIAVKHTAWILAGMALVAVPWTASAAERIVLCEEFTATW